jgi:hypothetical protein
VLVIPDYYGRAYVRDMIQLLLVRMGFKQLCVQQVLSCFPRWRMPDDPARNHWLQLTVQGYLVPVLSTSVLQQ